MEKYVPPYNETAYADCDFEGWAVINGMHGTPKCNIAEKAFSKQDGQTVPLIWAHIHDPKHVLGHGILEERSEGMYFYGYFLPDNENVLAAKQAIQNADVRTISIFANRLKNKDGKITEGVICEVSLVPWPEQSPEFQDTIITKHKDWNLNA